MKNLQRQARNSFIIFLMTSLIGLSLFIYGCCFIPTSAYYTSQLVILGHIIHAETFYIYLFLHGIQIRFEIITAHIQARRDLNGILLNNFKECYIKLYETSGKFNNCFKIASLLIFLQIISVMVFNSYWALMTILGYSIINESSNFNFS